MLKEGLDILESSEGDRLEAYLCPAGVPTIGYGHTGSDVHLGETITEEQSKAFEMADVAGKEETVKRLLNGSPTTEAQLSALTSFAYNEGIGKLAGSTLLAEHKKGHYASAAHEFTKWVYGRVNGHMVVLPGLVKRRAREAHLYLEGL